MSVSSPPLGIGCSIPELSLSSSVTGSRPMPVIGFGTASNASERVFLRPAVVEAIKLGYRHFDTAAIYGSEQLLGEGIAEAIHLGLITSREELFITSKLWCSDAHAQHVITAIRSSLRNLQIEYLDLYLVHWPISATPGKYESPVHENDLLPMDFKSVWASMEACQRLNLTKSIGVSNFSYKKIQHILTFATIPPSVNQVEMNPTWQQKKLRQLCKMNNIVVTAYSPLGAYGTKWGGDLVMGNQSLKEIAEARGKSIAQVSLRWVYEQGQSLVVRSFNAEWIKENLKILEWELTKEDLEKIDRIPQKKTLLECFLSPNGPYKSPKDLWDEDELL